MAECRILINGFKKDKHVFDKHVLELNFAENNLIIPGQGELG
jgi:hypothetical protein